MKPSCPPKRLSIPSAVQENAENRIGEQIDIRGWVRTVRNQKAFTFMEVRGWSIRETALC